MFKKIETFDACYKLYEEMADHYFKIYETLNVQNHTQIEQKFVELLKISLWSTKICKKWINSMEPNFRNILKDLLHNWDIVVDDSKKVYDATLLIGCKQNIGAFIL